MLLRFIEIVSLDERLDVEPRTTDNKWQAPPHLTLLDKCGNTRNKRRNRKRFIRVQHIDEMMRDTCLLCNSRLCTADIKSTIDTHGIARYDIRPKRLGKFQRKFCLSDCRRAEQHEE